MPETFKTLGSHFPPSTNLHTNIYNPSVIKSSHSIGKMGKLPVYQKRDFLKKRFYKLSRVLNCSKLSLH